ncbi:MAG TPA: permease, partial [Guyparkeria sp.]|nr:permease [Guyparkeria sp.]
MSPQLQDTLGMFAFLAVELSALFIGISLLVGMLQRHIPPSRVEALLSSSRRRSYLLAAGLGAITPFCSCSTIPMLKGLIRARAGFGPMMVFLFASPLLNPIIVVLLIATFGLTLTTIYVLAALLVSLAAGWLLQELGFERQVRREASREAGEDECCGASPAI